MKTKTNSVAGKLKNYCAEFEPKVALEAIRGEAANLEHGAEPITPIRRKVRAWKPDCPAPIARNEILWPTRCLERKIWKKGTGSLARSRVVAQMNRLNLLGERIMSRDPDRETSEIKIHIAIMSRCAAIGTAEIKTIASFVFWGTRTFALSCDWRN